MRSAAVACVWWLLTLAEAFAFHCCSLCHCHIKMLLLSIKFYLLPPLLQGIWWMPEADDAHPQQLGSSAALRAAEAAAVGGEGGGLAGPELLRLAASLRMNTGGWAW